MERLAQDIIATLRESLLVLDSELRVQVANRSFYRTFQLQPSEVEGRPLFELGQGEWDIPSLRRALQRVVVYGETFEDFAVEHTFPQIGLKVMLLNARRVEQQSEPGAEIVAGKTPLLLVIDDITEQRRAEATVQSYLRRLEWSNRELEDFAYVASHDLQEPLRAIQAFSDRLHNKHAASLDEQGADYLERIRKAAGRMRQLISDLLTYSRVTTQGKPFERVNLAGLARECVADLSRRLEETRGHINIGELPVLDADPVQMRQLLQNLLDNGLKFHRVDEPPVVTVRSHVEAGPGFEIPAPALVRRDYAFISVQDNGIGFEDKYRDRIFAPFERLHTQKVYAGTGIGLAVCRRIVERHGGSLTVRSAPGQGTVFYLVLPLGQAPGVE